MASIKPFEDEPVDPTPPGSTEPLLGGRQRVLVDALRAKSAKCDRMIGMYMEALRALHRADGAEALHVAAYELREFMLALPVAFDLPVIPPVQLNNRVKDLAAKWSACTALTVCFGSGEWRGDIDGALAQFLADATDFFEWVEGIPKRRTETEMVLQRLLPASFPMPRPLIDTRILEWKQLLGYFNAVLHHNIVTTTHAFIEYLTTLEIFLLDHLAPSTFDDQDAIDQLISGGEMS
jgi:hypothetical protein